ncbi:MAG: hypothetical protein ACYTFG_20935, partial [Planctomycetota bacterium]
GQEQEGGWCGYAWPVEWGRSGKVVYFCNGGGETWESTDFKLEGAGRVPRPTSTERPTVGSWTRTNRLVPLPSIARKLTIIRGEFESRELDDLVMLITSLRFQLDQFALAKILSDPDYRAIETVSRRFNHEKGDFMLTKVEAARTMKGYSAIVRTIYLRRARLDLLTIQKVLLDYPGHPFEEELNSKLVELSARDTVAADFTVVTEFRRSVHDFAKRVDEYCRRVKREKKG